MKLSSRSKYGIRAMVALASIGGNVPVSINTISKKENISAYYLDQLFALLKNGNLIRSTRGARGGYVLSKSPDRITVGEIFKLLEGPLEIADCADGTTCSGSSDCITKVLWDRIRKNIENLLNSITLQDILNDYEKFN